MRKDFAKFQIQAALKKDQDQRQRAKAMRSTAENIRIDPVQDRADQNPSGHQNDNVGHVREAHQTIGNESENEKAAEKSKEKRQIHEVVRGATEVVMIEEMSRCCNGKSWRLHFVEPFNSHARVAATPEPAKLRAMEFRFEVLKTDPTGARLGRLTTPHGVIDTPAFMPVGTSGTVKGLTQQALGELGVQILLGNTYHLYLRPGHELIRRLGGLHRFMSWPGAILTDSGGFQVFSLADLRKVTDEGVIFRSHLDGSEHFLTPEKSIEIQQSLGSDIAMVLDECIEYPADHARASAAARRTTEWARRCRDYARANFDASLTPGQVLFPIVQGGTHADLRGESARQLVDLDMPGYAVGGLAVGEPHALTCEMTAAATAELPADRPRYLMGVGLPEQLVDYVARGVDMMDCVLPTRNARNGCLFTSAGRINIKNACYAEDSRPLDERCVCMVCRTYSRAYLRHLFQASEMLAAILNSHHNVAFFLDIMGKIRQAIAFGDLAGYSSELQASLEAGPL